MKYYFESEKRQKALKKILDSWIGTPFRHRTCVKGLGVDCIHYAGSVFQELGLVKDAMKIIKKFAGDYSPDWVYHKTDTKLLDGLKATFPIEEINDFEFTDIINGDILLTKVGKERGHSSIWFDGYLYHAVPGAGVVKENHKAYKRFKNVTTILRILEEE